MHLAQRCWIASIPQALRIAIFMPKVFYSAKLYPFMDRVLALIRQADTAFYLTGGTALGRHYLHHRYSDDLDLFVNAAGDFREQVKKAMEALRRGGIALEPGTAAETFVGILGGEEGRT